MLDLIVIHDGSPLSTVKVGVDLLTGYLDRNTRIDTFRISSASISRSGEGPVHVDGEPLHLGSRLDVVCDALSLKVCAPEKMETFKPIVSPFLAMLSDLRYDMISKFRQ